MLPRRQGISRLPPLKQLPCLRAWSTRLPCLTPRVENPFILKNARLATERQVLEMVPQRLICPTLILSHDKALVVCPSFSHRFVVPALAGNNRLKAELRTSQFNLDRPLS